MYSVAWLCLCRVSGYPPFSDERNDMDLPKQIMGGHFSFPKQYWDGVSEDGKQLMPNRSCHALYMVTHRHATFTHGHGIFT